ncbi:DUF3304 domain-containing protein [Dyella monticola]|uniref:DUF3304 domain-containing protein n=2 Tax=Dyella monticola TaxID=1927958 RepID=A0A370WXQ1_9GAMM|nr:DUF3304 domain-containing protein [Dyella monticola]
MPADGHRKYSPRRRFALLLVVLLTIFSLSGCQADDDTMGLDVVGYNHTDRDIGSFYVNDRGGALLMHHKGGGGFVCCVAIPRKYTPNMTVTVSWTDEAGKHPQERIVAVPPYTPEDGGVFAVHFLRNGDIKVFVTMYLLQHPNYPLKGDQARM